MQIGMDDEEGKAKDAKSATWIRTLAAIIMDAGFSENGPAGPDSSSSSDLLSRHLAAVDSTVDALDACMMDVDDGLHENERAGDSWLRRFHPHESVFLQPSTLHPSMRLPTYKPSSLAASATPTPLTLNPHCSVRVPISFDITMPMDEDTPPVTPASTPPSTSNAFSLPSDAATQPAVSAPTPATRAKPLTPPAMAKASTATPMAPGVAGKAQGARPFGGAGAMRPLKPTSLTSGGARMPSAVSSMTGVRGGVGMFASSMSRPGIAAAAAVAAAARASEGAKRASIKMLAPSEVADALDAKKRKLMAAEDAKMKKEQQEKEKAEQREREKAEAAARKQREKEEKEREKAEKLREKEQREREKAAQAEARARAKEEKERERERIKQEKEKEKAAQAEAKEKAKLEKQKEKELKEREKEEKKKVAQAAKQEKEERKAKAAAAKTAADTSNTQAQSLAQSEPQSQFHPTPATAIPATPVVAKQVDTPNTTNAQPTTVATAVPVSLPAAGVASTPATVQALPVSATPIAAAPLTAAPPALSAASAAPEVPVSHPITSVTPLAPPAATAQPDTNAASSIDPTSMAALRAQAAAEAERILVQSNKVTPEQKEMIIAFLERRSCPPSPSPGVPASIILHEEESMDEKGRLARFTTILEMDGTNWTWRRVKKKKILKKATTSTPHVHTQATPDAQASTPPTALAVLSSVATGTPTAASSTAPQ